MDFITIFNNLDFLSESLRFQYTNFLMRNLDYLPKDLDFDDLLKRLKNDEPLEYIINLAEFCGNIFYVNKGCLIPRYETEEIVIKTYNFINKNPEEYTIIDVGTGSGCILLSLARLANNIEHQKVKFIGIDKSEKALEVARNNRTKFRLEDRVELINSSFEDFDFSKYKNLIVLANLPYIPNARKLQKSVANFEPKEALYGGKKGDEKIQELKSKILNLPNLKFFLIEKDQGIIETIKSI